MLASHAGVGDDDVEAPCFVVDAHQGVAHTTNIGDVDDDGVGLASGCLNASDKFLQGQKASSAQPHGVTASSELQGEGRAYS